MLPVRVSFLSELVIELTWLIPKFSDGPYHLAPVVWNVRYDSVWLQTFGLTTVLQHPITSQPRKNHVTPKFEKEKKDGQGEGGQRASSKGIGTG